MYSVIQKKELYSHSPIIISVCSYIDEAMAIKLSHQLLNSIFTH